MCRTEENKQESEFNIVSCRKRKLHSHVLRPISHTQFKLFSDIRPDKYRHVTRMENTHAFQIDKKRVLILY
jgi:hypothetical protein